jgi:hypothetical protein
LRESAKARQVEALAKGNKTRHQSPVKEKIPEPEAKPAPQTRDIRAKVAWHRWNRCTADTPSY